MAGQPHAEFTKHGRLASWDQTSEFSSQWACARVLNFPPDGKQRPGLVIFISSLTATFTNVDTTNHTLVLGLHPRFTATNPQQLGSKYFIDPTYIKQKQ